MREPTLPRRDRRSRTGRRSSGAAAVTAVPAAGGDEEKVPETSIDECIGPAAPAITFILTGQPDLRAILVYAHFDALRTRIRLTQELTPMSLEETAGYIDHGLKIIHCQEKMFSDKAKMEVSKGLAGIARSVNTICYEVILRAAIDKKHVIDTLDLPPELA